MLSVEATGKNIEQAIENALFELKAPREDVEIKILEQGGFFRKAKVLVSISSDCIEKYEKKEQKIEQEELEKQEEKILEQEKNEESEQKLTENDFLDKVEDVEENSDKIEQKEVKKEEKPAKKDKKEIADIKKVENFVSGLLNKISLTAEVELSENDEEIFVNIKGTSDIIGYRGEGLNALQYLTSVFVGKNNRHAKKVRIDCDGYRARREASLVALANRIAKKVERTHQSVKLEPMTGNERRIIHTALAENEFVETYSKGEEPHRCLIVKFKDQNEN